MKNQSIQQQLNAPTAIATSVLMGIGGVTMFLYLPLFVGAIIDNLELSQQQVGYLAAADLLGLGIGSFLGVFWANKVNWKWTAIFVLASILVFNQLSIWQLNNISILLVLRFLSGLGQGSLLAIYSVHIAQTEKPEKIYGYFLAAQTIIAVIGLFFLPSFIQQYGVPVVIYGQGIVVFLALIMAILWMPQRGKTMQSEGSKHNTNYEMIAISLFGFLLFFIGQGGVWAFMERIGLSLELEKTFINNTLGLAMIGAFCGAMTAASIGMKFGRKIPLIAVGIGQALCLVLLFSGFGNWSFLVATIVYLFFWNIAIPYIVGILIGVDPSGKAVIGSNPVFALGASIAPILISFFLTGDSFISVGLVGGTAIVLSMIVFLGLAWKIE